MRRMRHVMIVAAILSPLLQACSLGPVLPGGCDQLAMSEARQKACDSGLAASWSKHATAQTSTEPEPQCRRTIGGVECYAPAR